MMNCTIILLHCQYIRFKYWYPPDPEGTTREHRSGELWVSFCYQICGRKILFTLITYNKKKVEQVIQSLRNLILRYQPIQPAFPLFFQNAFDPHNPVDATPF